MKSHLIIGYGEIGKAVEKVLEGTAVVEHIDQAEGFYQQDFDFIHICFSYSPRFKIDTAIYKIQYHGKFVVHSTVPVGTCEKMKVAHSPVIGVHPHLYKSLMTFTKYVAGPGAREIQREFRKAGVKSKVVKSTRDTEGAKLWSTAYHGMLIVLNKEIKRWCGKNDVDFDFAYKEWNKNYNKGYAELGKQFVKPILKYMPGKIGGHCILSNCEMLNSWVAGIVREKNMELTGEM